MSDPIVSKVAQQAADQAAQQGASKSQPEANAADQAKFEEAFNQPSDANAAQGPNGAQHARQKQAVSKTEETSMGDAILQSVENMKSSHDARAERIQDQLMNVGGEPMSVEDCMKVNFEVMQMSLEQDLTSKIATKSSDGVQTLFKNG